MCRLLCCGCQMQKDQILLNPEEPPCTLLQSTSEPPEMGWRWAVPKAECSTGWRQKGDGCSSSEFTVKLADVCVTAEDQPWKQEQKGERQSWCIISVTAEVHGWVLGAGKRWCSLSLVGEGASTKEVKQRVGQNICNYFFLYCQETDYNHSSAWVVSFTKVLAVPADEFS